MNSVEISPASFDKSCRLCLSANGKLYQLFGPDETETLPITLSMKVTLCTAIAISKYDKLPKKICQNCFNYVNDWYIFRKKCLRINSLLKQNLYSQTIKDNGNEQINDNKEMPVVPITDEEEEKYTTLKNLEEPQLEAKSNEEVKFGDLEVNLFKGNAVDENARVNDNTRLDESTSQNEITNKAVVPYLDMRKDKFKCISCPDSFYYWKDLKLHRAILHNFIKSGTPEKVSTITADVDVRLEGINMRTRYEMKCCDKVFFSRSRFRKHYNEKHPGEKPFMCETCGKKDFISEETLKRHKVLHEGKFRCEICFKTFTCNAILILHKRDKHENDKPFICDVCGKRFVSELLMNYHKRFHTGEKKYVCEECGLAVVTSSSLAKHKRIHSEEKPHVCHICGKGFIIKGRLIEHLRVHTGERPYICLICQKGFTMRDKLKRHLRVHSGEKLFSCEYCGNNYSTRYGLSVHLKTHLI